MGLVSVFKKLMEPKQKITYSAKQEKHEDRNFYRVNTGSDACEFKYTPLSTDKIPVMLYDKEQKTCLCPYHLNWETFTVKNNQLITECGKSCERFLKVKFKRVEFPSPTYAVYDFATCEFVSKIAEGKKKVEVNDADLKTVYQQTEIADDVVFISFTKNLNTDNYAVVLSLIDRVVLENKSYFKFGKVPLQRIYFSFNCKTGRVEDAYGGPLADYLEDMQNSMPEKIYKYISEEIKKELRRQYGEHLALNYSGNAADELKSVVKFPYEPNIMDFVNAQGVKVDREDPEVFNHVCQEMQVHNHKVLRKNFAKDPSSLSIAVELAKLGFRDENYMDGFVQEGYGSFFNCLRAESGFDAGSSIVEFYNTLVAERGEGPAMNVLKKNALSFSEEKDVHTLMDGAHMWLSRRKILRDRDPELHTRVMKEGLNKSTHDALSLFLYEIRQSNIEFEYTNMDRALEGSFFGYDFKLAENSRKLGSIGIELHNCVGSYVDRVLDGKCLIVYAEQNGKLKLCIEVRDHKEVHQMRADRNADPTGNDLLAVEAWRNAKKLSFSGNKY